MLNPADRKLLFLTGAVSAGLVALTVLFAAPARNVDETPTTYSVAPEGAKAAFLLLQRLHYDVKRWERPYSALPAGRGTLIIAQPQRDATTQEQSLIGAFIDRGGRVISTGHAGETYLHVHESLTNPTATAMPVTEHALAPTGITRAAAAITLVPRWNWIPSPTETPLYGQRNSVHAVRYTSEAGEAIWLADPTPLTNAGLQLEGNLDFLLAAIGDADHTVMWDEFAHGHVAEEQTPVNSAVYWIVLQLTLMAAVVLLTYSRRAGPVVPPAAESRLSPLEFVHTLGNLYRRAGATTVPLDVAWHQFRQLMSQRTGLATAASSASELDQAIRIRWQITDARVQELLQTCEAARSDPGLTASNALILTQRLSDLSARLALRPELSKDAVRLLEREESI